MMLMMNNGFCRIPFPTGEGSVRNCKWDVPVVKTAVIYELPKIGTVQPLRMDSLQSAPLRELLPMGGYNADGWKVLRLPKKIPRMKWCAILDCNTFGLSKKKSKFTIQQETIFIKWLRQHQPKNQTNKKETRLDVFSFRFKFHVCRGGFILFGWLQMRPLQAHIMRNHASFLICVKIFSLPFPRLRVV